MKFFMQLLGNLKFCGVCVARWRHTLVILSLCKRRKIHTLKCKFALWIYGYFTLLRKVQYDNKVVGMTKISSERLNFFKIYILHSVVHFPHNEKSTLQICGYFASLSMTKFKIFFHFPPSISPNLPTKTKIS